MKLLKIIILLIIAASLNLMSQVPGLSGADTKELLQMEMDNQISDGMSLEAMPVGNAINPDFYLIGPGDMLSLQIFPIQTSPKNLIVSPDYTILLPRVGEISIKDMTLNEVKDTISQIYRAKMSGSKAFVILKEARKCIVNIKGNVLSPAIYTLPSSYQVSTAVSFANQLGKLSGVPIVAVEALLQVQEKQREADRLFSETGIPSKPVYWSRNVTLLRNDGSSLQIDLERAVFENDIKNDPYVKEGDQIIVPFDQQYFNQISITGAVTRPIVLPHKYGDKVSLLLKFGYGVTDDADLDNVFVFLPESKKRIKLQIDRKLNLLSEDFEVEPGSTIIVGQRLSYKKSDFGTVSVKGFVNSPGNYLIKLGETRLRDMVEMAGGFTQDAYLPLGRIIRRDYKQQSLSDPRQETYETMQYSDLKMDDTVRYYIDMKYKQPLVSTDFIEVFENNSEIHNVLLYDGDVIEVPNNPGKVRVFGQVKNPGFVEFQPGKTMAWYVERAGGYAEGSQSFRARIIRGRTQVWLEGAEDVFVYAGDQIYVPRVPDEPTTIKLQRYAVLASIVATVGVLINTIAFILLR
ncbi:MAG: SLBB domain-containing protein [Candidatus Kapabacteria bacterium]|nr:SLBB domain-containing protein [Ignavibacteriota bacterium]MCW5885882.1 SLBB domain-containing protein [Candidatus Kapabacteria bacterium]